MEKISPVVYKSRINLVQRRENGLVEKRAGMPFWRRGFCFDPQEILKREIFFLECLQPSCHFPKIVATDAGAFCMEYCGEVINRNLLPENWVHQVEEMANQLEKMRIIHRDIKKQNLLVFEGILVLIDFGWAIFQGEQRICPQDLVEDIPKELIYNNRMALDQAFCDILK